MRIEMFDVVLALAFATGWAISAYFFSWPSVSPLAGFVGAAGYLTAAYNIRGE